ncbi:phage portal protein [Novosphingobium resinovorum]|uniref:Phage portal protein n=1 Tax=Novosphingobium resinovorum TaxID=158500 RepID=A0A1D8A396_9SPHN|nr:phage portal protein [Novosphingobium resinovorum]AOR76579.1 phage portal protein [Novosphingobium resinovorum]
MSDEFTDLLAREVAAPPAKALVPAVAGGEVALGAFEGADRFNSTIALWDSPLKSADLEILPEKTTVDGRARDMLRNDAFVQGGANLHKDNIVGSHYLLNCRPATRVLLGKDDDLWEEEFQEEVEAKWELYSDSPENWIDAARTNNFTSLVRMAVGIHLMGGEVLAAAEWTTDDGSPYSTAIQMVDLDRLSDPKDMTGWRWIQSPDQRAGVRYNRRGAPVSYFVRSAHPNDYGPVDFAPPKWDEIDRTKPWGRLQMIHLFEQVRPEQTRGITEMAAALKAMKITHTWRDITVQHAVTQAMYAAAITSELPTADILQRMGGDSPEAAQAAIAAYAQGYMGAVGQYVGKGGIAIDGVKVPRLFPGEKFELKSAAGNGPLGSQFEQSLLRYMAAAIGVSYEQLSRDYTNTNYSSARASMAETWKFMQARKKLIADRFATIIFRLWLEEAINAGDIESAKRFRIYNPPRPGQRYGRLNSNFDALSRCDWVGASRGQIDELKETQAAVLRINNGLSTAEDELARLGKDWRKVYRQLKREMALREALGLQFMATDPATMAAMNALSATPSDEGDSPRG